MREEEVVVVVMWRGGRRPITDLNEDESAQKSGAEDHIQYEED